MYDELPTDYMGQYSRAWRRELRRRRMRALAEFCAWCTVAAGAAYIVLVH